MRLINFMCIVLLSVSAYAGVTDDFFKAVAAGDVNLAEKLLDKGAGVNAVDTGGETALIKASSANNKSMVKMLLKKGADPNKTNEGYSAIIYAVNSGYIEIVKMLIEKGANVNQVHLDGTTPLINATLINNTELVKLLLDKGADPSIKDYGRKTALNYAKNNQIKELLKNSKKTGK